MKAILWKVIIPMMLGLCIYLLFRNNNNLYIVRWLGLSMNKFSDINVPNIVKYNIPDALWLYSMMQAMVVIWKNDLKHKFFIACYHTPFIIAISSELLQYVNPLWGTFDILDIFFYSITFLILKIK